MEQNPYEAPIIPAEDREPSRLALLLRKIMPHGAEVLVLLACLSLFLLAALFR